MRWWDAGGGVPAAKVALGVDAFGSGDGEGRYEHGGARGNRAMCH